ncbi:MAG: hypothetical protein ACXABY_34020 [Candidatus Thorarchaeota archaeon]|jgi:hypothetical protein
MNIPEETLKELEWRRGEMKAYLALTLPNGHITFVYGPDEAMAELERRLVDIDLGPEPSDYL